MLKLIKRILGPERADAQAAGVHERGQLQLAVAVLVHEARRSDYAEEHVESAAAEQALRELLGLAPAESAALLERGRAKAQQLSSFYAPVSAVKRAFSLEERIRLVEHLWRVAFADGLLNPYEDHYVRKIAHLLYVPNTRAMLARNRARG